MPNGVDANFVRFISCIRGFRERFNRWPTKIRIGSIFFDELKKVMKPEEYIKLNNKIAIIFDDSNPWDSLFVAEDDDGNAYDLGKYGHGSSQFDVLHWLEIEWPDYDSY